MYMMFICNEIAVDRLFVSDVYFNAREIREVLAIFFRDLMKDKLRAVGVSGRDLADDDDEYTLE